MNRVTNKVRGENQMGKIGLCLTGGGARGAYQIGAVAALQELGILKSIKAYSGTSIGSANALMLATNTLEVCKNVWLEMNDDNLKKSEGLIERLKRDGLRVFEEGIYKIDALQSLMEQHVKKRKFKNLKVYATVAEVGEERATFFDILKASYKHYKRQENHANYIELNKLNKELMIKTVIASCSIPIVFSPVKQNGKKYYDGGMFDNVPVQPLIEAGCDEIIVIHLHKLQLFRASNYPEVVFHEIKHKGSLGSVLAFTKEHSEQIYQYGYEDTMEYFKNAKNIK